MTMLRFFCFACLVQVARADDKPSALHGSWRSDGEATRAYLDEHAKLDEFQRKMIGLMFGRATVTFKPDGSGSLRMDPMKVPTKEGAELALAESTTGFTYRILGETESQIVIESRFDNAALDAQPFAVLKFDGKDRYSVALSDGIAEINGREFFTRVKEGGQGEAAAPDPDDAEEP
ncbi:hypothetical protein [Luteolibacter marinus]|uniref:hypothetical protein n=1 Tax=Luteolibacter marinus TaxID=2776705 RepID=UPI0018671AB7|nr:hypothetical protein [Luteolibacter marinus]